MKKARTDVRDERRKPTNETRCRSAERVRERIDPKQ